MSDLTLPPVDIAGAALSGAQRHLAVGDPGAAMRYRPEVSPFASLGPAPADEAWRQLAALPGDGFALIAESDLILPEGWRTNVDLTVLELFASPVGGDDADPDPEILELTGADVPEMLDLAGRTRPGPFLAETIAFGGYVGIRRDGVLAAMAGRRMQPGNCIEVSAVCADPAHRGAGLGRRVTAAVMRGISAEGAVPFLHVLEENPARRLYESMGFTERRRIRIVGVQRGGTVPPLHER